MYTPVPFHSLIFEARPVDLIDSRSIFSPATGFIRRGGFEWTCNPYIGCTFGCSYCYAAFLPQNRRPAEEWGRWITAKKNAAALAEKQAPKVAGQPVYMSSVTDPYQPVERGLMLTRGILAAIQPHQPRLAIQTRGPLVARDIDVLKGFRALRVNMSIPTDSEKVRGQFEPKAPPLEKRWEALRQVKEAGIAVGVCVGFLPFNFNPARIFMGDAGSYFIGFTIGIATLSATYTGYNSSQQHAILAPLCVMAVPLYDMTTVIWIRLREGRSPFEADKCHFSHRLVDLGMTKVQAVLTIYLTTATCGLGALLLRRVDTVGAVMIVVMILCILSLIAILEASARRRAKP